MLSKTCYLCVEKINHGKTCYPQGFDKLLQEQVDYMAGVVITDEEIRFMTEKLQWLPLWYFTFLRGYRFNPGEVAISQDAEGHLSITIHGKWFSTIMWEMPLLSCISELRHMLNGGTFTGTSNVWFALELGLNPLGTMSHQLISFEENVSGVFECNYNVMKKFSDVYDGNNGIYLYDCFGDDVFFKNLSKRMAMMYSGFRVDSGNEEEQTEKIIEKYHQLGIDPATKQVVYSNGLDVDRCIAIHEYCRGRVKDSYGVGTQITCDVDNAQPSNIVIKLTKCRITEMREWHDCIKLSCDKGKTLGNEVKCNYILSLIG